MTTSRSRCTAASTAPRHPLSASASSTISTPRGHRQGLTHVHFSAYPEPVSSLKLSSASRDKCSRHAERIVTETPNVSQKECLRRISQSVLPRNYRGVECKSLFVGVPAAHLHPCRRAGPEPGHGGHDHPVRPRLQPLRGPPGGVFFKNKNSSSCLTQSLTPLWRIGQGVS